MQCCPTGGPWAACDPRRYSVWPTQGQWKYYTLLISPGVNFGLNLNFALFLHHSQIHRYGTPSVWVRCMHSVYLHLSPCVCFDVQMQHPRTVRLYSWLICERTSQVPLSDIIHQRRLTLFGHVACVEHSHWHSMLVDCSCSGCLAMPL